ncbi:hypothetical protein C4546_02225 [Candidatus Parcubacteria bacterium]|jgi:hypothetical protein|nr:MAG: hypothetical protein C4546_02225 [Candidatus Parcubacteria bacterium]
MSFPLSSMHSGFDLRAGVDFFGVCPLCKTSYEPLSVRLLAAQEERHLLHIVCQKCRVASLALVLVQNTGIKAVEVVTDLNSTDAVRLGQQAPISADEVLALHQALA